MTRPLVLAALVLLAAAPAAQAQPTTGGLPNVAEVELVYARPGRATIPVYVLGDVGRPGKWRIETDTRLLDMLAVAGPTTAPLDGSVARPTERVEVKLYREAGGRRTLAYDGNLNDLLVGSEATMVLEEGDLLRVDAVPVPPRTSWRDVLSTVGTVASVAALVVTLVR